LTELGCHYSVLSPLVDGTIQEETQAAVPLAPKEQTTPYCLPEQVKAHMSRCVKKPPIPTNEIGQNTHPDHGLSNQTRQNLTKGNTSRQERMTVHKPPVSLADNHINSQPAGERRGRVRSAPIIRKLNREQSQERKLSDHRLADGDMGSGLEPRQPPRAVRRTGIDDEVTTTMVK